MGRSHHRNSGKRWQALHRHKARRTCIHSCKSAPPAKRAARVCCNFRKRGGVPASCISLTYRTGEYSGMFTPERRPALSALLNSSSGALKVEGTIWSLCNGCVRCFRNFNAHLSAPLPPGNFRALPGSGWMIQQLFTMTQVTSRITATTNTLPLPKPARLELAGAKGCILTMN